MPKLTRIHWGENPQTPLINEHRSYLVKIYGSWYAGSFSMQWYGWNFDNWGTSGIQLSPYITEVYLIEET
jgi:hypothetical protein